MVGFFVNGRQNFRKLKKYENGNMSFYILWKFLPMKLFFFLIIKLSNSFLNSRFADLGVFANTSELIFLSFFRKHPYIWIILPGS